MPLSEKIETLIRTLPDAEGARRFYALLAEKFPAEEKKLARNEGLLSDILTLAAFSPLLATTILQNPHYIQWLNRQRVSSEVRGKDEILESLERFALVNSSVEMNIALARFRRRELLRIYLRDIRNLGTMVEITEEISNLADAVLEYALRQTKQELDNRYGAPLERDEKTRARQARFCIVALGKLGSKELNYSSDIDLLFLYSNDGTTSGHGKRGTVTNREYFVKLAELVTRLVGGQTGEGAAYRVDLRLRPNGRVGALAIPVSEAISYYQRSAQSWERQVLIRSRVAAGDADVFQKFFGQVKSCVFSRDEKIENALRNVRLSKEKINAEKTAGVSFNVKLGKGGIREIEFIAQALQLAYAGKDEWLRAPHTLISLSRLADRHFISETELTELFEAYTFLRRLEHRMQMENGLQTHLVPNEPERRLLLARRMGCANLKDFENTLQTHTQNVSRIFTRVFGAADSSEEERDNVKIKRQTVNENQFTEDRLKPIISSLKKSNVKCDLSKNQRRTLDFLSKTTPHYAEIIAANPYLIKELPDFESSLAKRNYRQILLSAVGAEADFKSELAVLRRIWSRFLMEIVVFDVFEKITRQESKRLQTELAEASLEAAIFITKRELEKRYEIEIAELPLAVLGLGKLGGGGIDYGSDLDLILIYDESQFADDETMRQSDGEKSSLHAAVLSSHRLPVPLSVFYGRASEIFVTTLSSLTREGLLYRVDLRLRPDGKNGATAISKTAFLNYIENRAAIWEWLAYVKLRGAAGDLELAKEIESAAREIIHRKAQNLIADDSGLKTLAEETQRIRKRLEAEKASGRRGAKEIDIKYGEGGMLDVYFAVRFLQLRDNVPDDEANRSTAFTLKNLYDNESLNKVDFQNFSAGYEFLSELDHNLRLIVGRSTRLPANNQNALEPIVERMNSTSGKDLFEQLTAHRLNVRASFENIFHIKL
jgi:[glutamine synthetase] adenylyltransferase / [glutamine synthetase]-adenylyl-L-tyrosine phosphorylase